MKRFNYEHGLLLHPQPGFFGGWPGTHLAASFTQGILGRRPWVLAFSWLFKGISSVHIDVGGCGVIDVNLKRLFFLVSCEDNVCL